jgi:adenylate cyclase
VTATGTVCTTCGTEPSRVGARFCDACGSPLAGADDRAEFKQVTVLFADVVHSMDIAASVGAERLREIMAEFVDRSTAVVRRCGGSVDKFTGDGLMALFGAPIALEDHAIRACLAALDIEAETQGLAAEVELRDGVDLKLRVGLNSGQVIAGEVGTGPLGYTAVGEQVGMAQRMESVAPSGGVMLSESTARLVEHAAVLAAPEMVHIKGFDEPVRARRLLDMRAQRRQVGRRDSALVGRQPEIAALATMLERAIGGSGCVVGVVGAAGIGKSRLVRETEAMARQRGVEVFSTFCESHASEIAFHAAAGLLRAMFGVGELDGQAAREQVRAQLPHADKGDLVLLNDLLAIRDTAVPPSDMDPDARRRRIARLINTFVLARTAPGVYVIEDVHWIDQASEAMLTEVVAALRHTRALVLITHRPEYRGVLNPLAGLDTIALAPLDDSQTTALIAELLGAHTSVAGLTAQIGERAAGNPFFAEELVRDLAERNVLDGERGAYLCRADSTEVTVPATVQATIAARIDRLGSPGKRTLNAAAVIGSRFDADLLRRVLGDTALGELVEAELIVSTAPSLLDEYEFHHPLIRAVAYESQLKSMRVQLHQRVAAAIQQRAPGAVEENAALIASHQEAAGDLRAAFGWHMRAGAWLTNRDIGAARLSWQRAQRLADRMPVDDPDRLSMRIAPRTLLWGTAYRVGGTVADTGFDELRALCDAAGDQISLAMGMSGLLVSLTLNQRLHELATLADEYAHLLESIGDPTLIVGLMNTAGHPKLAAGHIAGALQLAERVIELADGDTTKGNFFFESPLAWGITLRGLARCTLGDPRWRDDLQAGLAMARAAGGITQSAVTIYGYAVPIMNGALLPDASIVRDTGVALKNAEQFGDNVSLAWARITRGMILTRLGDADEDVGWDILQKGREQARRHGDLLTATTADVAVAEYKAQIGDIDDAIKMSRTILGHLFDRGEMFLRGPATTVLVESLLRRGAETDLREARAAIDQLASVPTEPGFVLYEVALCRLRALLARAHGDEAAYRALADRYRAMATSLGFEGHTALAETMS